MCLGQCLGVGRLAGEHHPFFLAQYVRRLEPGVGERRDGALKRTQRLGRPSLRRETLDQPRPGTFPQWLGCHECFRRGDCLVGAARAQQCGNPCFGGATPQLLEPTCLGRDARDVGVLRESRAAPEAEGRVENRNSRSRFCAPGVAVQRFEASGIDIVGCRRERVARASTHDGVAENRAHTRDVGAQCRHRTRRSIVAPHRLGEGVERDCLAEACEQHGKDPSLGRTPERDSASVGVDQLHRTKYSELHGRTPYGLWAVTGCNPAAIRLRGASCRLAA